MKEISIQGMSIAPSVIETIVSLALNDIDGVVAVGTTPMSSLVAAISGKGGTQGVDCAVTEDGELSLGVHIQVAYGTPLPAVAAAVRAAAFDAVTKQLGVPVSRVDVFVDGVQFKD